MFERFTDRGRKIIILAREEAERHQNDYLGTEHLVLAYSSRVRWHRPDDHQKDGGFRLNKSV